MCNPGLFSVNKSIHCGRVFRHSASVNAACAFLSMGEPQVVLMGLLLGGCLLRSRTL